MLLTPFRWCLTYPRGLHDEGSLVSVLIDELNLRNDVPKRLAQRMGAKRSDSSIIGRAR